MTIFNHQSSWQLNILDRVKEYSLSPFFLINEADLSLYEGVSEEEGPARMCGVGEGSDMVATIIIGSYWNLSGQRLHSGSI